MSWNHDQKWFFAAAATLILAKVCIGDRFHSFGLPFIGREQRYFFGRASELTVDAAIQTAGEMLSALVASGEKKNRIKVSQKWSL